MGNAMSEITRLEQQKHNGERVNVYIDGVFYCGVQLEVAMKYRLKEGMQITKERLDEIQLDNEKGQAMDKALTHLSATLKTEKQMNDFLLGKGYTQAVVDYVMERLLRYGYVDDVAYCKAYVNSTSGKGKRALEQNLIKRGAKKSAIDEVLATVEEDDEEVAGVLQKYLRGKEISKETLYKGMKYLLSKGYAYETAKAAVDRYQQDDEI
jgi:regulatory protein